MLSQCRTYQEVWTASTISPLPYTVRADITDLRTDPDSPIEGTDTGCLSAGSTAMIICDNTAFPIATVEFLNNGELIDPNVDEEDR